MLVPQPREAVGRSDDAIRLIPRPRTVRIGRADLACVSMTEALATVRSLAAGRRPALVVTANADHIVRMETDDGLAAAYAGSDLALIDGQPLAWTAALMSVRTPRVAGVDLFTQLCALADDGIRLFMLGGSEHNSARALSVLRRRYPRLNVVGRNTAWVSDSTTPAIAAQIRDSGANVVAVFYGCPKQERWVAANRHLLPPGAYLCLGGTIDIVSGALPRAGRRWQHLGLEWLHRLFLEPRRLWRRYLLDDPRFAVLAVRSIRRARTRS